jgi:hypothetical protein
MRQQRTIKTYSELSRLLTFEERFRYLSLKGQVGEETYGFDRWINQRFYRSREWKQIRALVIERDSGCDLGILGREIPDHVIVHHINPILVQDICDATEYLLNPEFLICTSNNTHQAIHYGDESLLITLPVKRTANDTCPWKH